MNLDPRIPKFLGIAYLIQFAGSLISDPLFTASTGSGSIAERLLSISNNTVFMRLFIVAELITCFGIIAMTVLLFLVLQQTSNVISSLALSFWLIEAFLLVVASICAYSLVPLSAEYVLMGAPDPSYFLTLGSLFLELKEISFAIHMLFFALGGILWYYLFFKSEYIPKPFSLFALIVFPLMTVDVILVLLGIGLDSIWRLILLASFIPYLPFEGILGTWFIVKGVYEQSSW